MHVHEQPRLPPTHVLQAQNDWLRQALAAAQAEAQRHRDEIRQRMQELYARDREVQRLTHWLHALQSGSRAAWGQAFTDSEERAAQLVRQVQQEQRRATLLARQTERQQQAITDAVRVLAGLPSGHPDLLRVLARLRAVLDAAAQEEVEVGDA